MINEVVLEGIVVKTWKYAEDLLFRIACYRDPDLPSKSRSEIQDAVDFVTIRVLKGDLGALVVVEKGVHVRVDGFLQSRDYEESLADFLKDAATRSFLSRKIWIRTSGADILSRLIKEQMFKIGSA